MCFPRILEKVYSISITDPSLRFSLEKTRQKEWMEIVPRTTPAVWDWIIIVIIIWSPSGDKGTVYVDHVHVHHGGSQWEGVIFDPKNYLASKNHWVSQWVIISDFPYITTSLLSFIQVFLHSYQPTMVVLVALVGIPDICHERCERRACKIFGWV